MNITTRQLFAWHQEIQSMNGSIHHIFNRSKIKEFYNDNGIRIDTMFKKLKEIQTEYFVIENEQIKKEGEGKDAKPVVQEGKTREEFDKKFNELMDSEITVKI